MHTHGGPCAHCQASLDLFWHAFEDLYDLALTLESQDPQLLEPLVDTMAALWKRKPQQARRGPGPR